MSSTGSSLRLEEIKAQILVSQYTNVAAATLYFYDILLTFGDELELVWKRQLFTFPAILYLSNRYIGFLTILYMAHKAAGLRGSSTDSATPYGMIGFVMGAASWAGIMALRVSALWRPRTVVVWAVWLSWSTFVCTMVGGGIFVYISLRPTLRYSPTLGICIAFTDSRILSALPAIEGGYVLLLTFLTAVKAYQLLPTLRTFRKPVVLIGLLFKDGLLYFVVVASFSIAAALTWNFLPSARLYMFITLNWSVFAILISRLFLRLRKMFYISDEDGTNVTNTSNTGIGSARIGSQFFSNTEFGILSLPEAEIEARLPALPTVRSHPTAKRRHPTL